MAYNIGESIILTMQTPGVGNMPTKNIWAMSPSSSQLTHAPAQSTLVRVHPVLGEPDQYLPPNTPENPQNHPTSEKAPCAFPPLMVIVVACSWCDGWEYCEGKKSTGGTEGEGIGEWRYQADVMSSDTRLEVTDITSRINQQRQR